MDEQRLAAIRSRVEVAKDGVFLLSDERRLIREDVPYLLSLAARLAVERDELRATLAPMLNVPFAGGPICRCCLAHTTVPHKPDCPVLRRASIAVNATTEQPS